MSALLQADDALLGTVLFHALFGLVSGLSFFTSQEIAAVFLVSVSFLMFGSFLLFLLCLDIQNTNPFECCWNSCPEISSPSARIVLAYIWSFIHFLLK